MGTYLFYAGITLTGFASLMYLAEIIPWQFIWIQIQNAFSSSEQEMYLKIVPEENRPNFAFPMLALGLLLLVASKYTN